MLGACDKLGYMGAKRMRAQLHVRMWKDGGMMGKANIWKCERIWGDKDLGKYEEWVMESESEGVWNVCVANIM